MKVSNIENLYLGGAKVTYFNYIDDDGLISKDLVVGWVNTPVAVVKRVYSQKGSFMSNDDFPEVGSTAFRQKCARN